MGADALAQITSLFRGDGDLSLFTKTVEGLLLFTKIELGANEHQLGVRAVVRDLGPPLGSDVGEGSGVIDGKTDEENVRLGVTEWTKTIVILLASSVPETETDGLVIDHDVGAVVVKDSGHVLLGERVAGVRNHQTSLSDSTVSDDDEFDTLHRHGGSVSRV